MALLASGRLDVRPIIGGVWPLAQWHTAFETMHAGEIVSTGTLTDAHPVAPGETWSTAFDGLPLPGLQIRFK